MRNLKKILLRTTAILVCIGGLTSALRLIITDFKDITVNIPSVENFEEKEIASYSNKAEYEYKQKGAKKRFIEEDQRIWKEYDQNADEINTFSEIGRNDNFIIIRDEARKMTVKIPIYGGMVLITWEPRNWVDEPYVYVKRVA